MFKILFVLLFSTHILANGEQGFIEVKYNGDRYSKVIGNGDEKGFSFQVDYYSRDHLTDTPRVFIPKKDNDAGCTLFQILPSTITNSYPTKLYKIFIKTSDFPYHFVGACLVLVRNKRGATIKIVEYSYRMSGYN